MPSCWGCAWAWLFGLLHILHDRMRRSYDDFKFENLWWEAEAQRLRVTDWNVMGDEKDLGVRVPWDLERGARVLLRVLTGAPLRPELRLDQQPRSQLSAGVQALLKRMLEMDRNRRPKTAEEICKELSLLIGYWLIESGRGLRNIEAALDGIAYGQDAAMLDEETLRRIEPTVRQTLAALSILHLRQQQETAAMSQAWPVALVQQLDTLQARAEQYAPSPERMVNTALTLLNGHSFPRRRPSCATRCSCSPTICLPIAGWSWQRPWRPAKRWQWVRTIVGERPSGTVAPEISKKPTESWRSCLFSLPLV
ncbi:MAG: hypothetical protein HZY76_22805 [Anaerolineae bacterium]|nr:MAG: hypothetical protein HZY76_22805 [Anaerolineae bacterium]